MSNRQTVHQTMLRVAQVLAERSTCSRRNVGVVFTDSHNRIIASGYNGVPKGEIHCISQSCPGAAYPSGQGLDQCRAIHAEINALMFCPDITKVANIYSTHFPCLQCIKALQNTSAKCIYYIDEYTHEDAARYWEGLGGKIKRIEL